ncbi:hypothetical protein X975_04578, partial [Stegodyphus mimosarum]
MFIIVFCLLCPNMKKMNLIIYKSNSIFFYYSTKRIRICILYSSVTSTILYTTVLLRFWHKHSFVTNYCTTL